jgi:hypothetical protein
MNLKSKSCFENKFYIVETATGEKLGLEVITGSLHTPRTQRNARFELVA